MLSNETEQEPLTAEAEFKKFLKTENLPDLLEVLQDAHTAYVLKAEDETNYAINKEEFMEIKSKIFDSVRRFETLIFLVVKLIKLQTSKTEKHG